MTVNKIHPSIVRHTFASNDSLAYYIDTHALKRGTPYKYYDALATNVDENHAGNIKALMTVNDRRWARMEKQVAGKKKSRFKYANQYDTDTTHVKSDEEMQLIDQLRKLNQSKAINEIEEAWFSKKEPSWPAVKHIREGNWEAAELVFSHA